MLVLVPTVEYLRGVLKLEKRISGMVSLVIKRFVSSNVFVWNKSAWPTNILSEATSSCFVRENFITEAEESCLVAELEPHMKRLKYEHDHWDNAIYLYREREQRKWSTENTKVIQRILDVSFPTVDPAKRSPFIHILDLHQDGHIKPHIDSTRVSFGQLDLKLHMFSIAGQLSLGFH
jgi:hypothetical protein